MPAVTIAAAQTLATLTSITNAVTVAQATAANLNCTEASASAIKSAVETIDNAISGSEMQVDIVATLPTGTNSIGKMTQSTLHDSTSYDHAVFDGSADGNLVAAVAGKVIKVHSIVMQAQGTVTVNITDGAAGASLMEWTYQAREGICGLPFAFYPAHWFQTSVNTALYVDVSAALYRGKTDAYGNVLAKVKEIFGESDELTKSETIWNKDLLGAGLPCSGLLLGVAWMHMKFWKNKINVARCMIQDGNIADLKMLKLATADKTGVIGFDFRVAPDGKFEFFAKNSKTSSVSLSERLAVSTYSNVGIGAWQSLSFADTTFLRLDYEDTPIAF